MSMTQIVLIKKSELPNKDVLEKAIKSLGFNFKFLEDFKDFDGLDEISCEINGVQTSFEIYFNSIDDLLTDFPELKDKVKDFDYGVSFVWGADYAAAACIGIISIALIDICNSEIFYTDDEIWYSKEMLIEDISLFLKELGK